MNRPKCLLIIITLLSINCFGIKQIHNYKKIKKDINTISNVIIVNLLEVQYDKNIKSSEWGAKHSNRCDSIAFFRISQYIKNYSNRKFKIRTISYKSDSLLNSHIVNLLGKLDSTKIIDSIQINNNLINAFSDIADRYILLVYIEGYCFPNKYLIDMAENAIFQSGASLGGIVAGCFRFRNKDKGYSSIGIALIDKSLKKVLFFSKQSRDDDPVGDSAIIKQLEPMLIWL